MTNCTPKYFSFFSRSFFMSLGLLGVQGQG